MIWPSSWQFGYCRILESKLAHSRSLTTIRKRRDWVRDDKSGESKVGYRTMKAHTESVSQPDIIIPNVDAYRDSRYPLNKLFMVGVKTTCKDRWRQVLNEAKRIKQKHIMTTQRGISRKQLDEMREAGVQLIVPIDYHKQYPRSDMKLLGVEEFVGLVRKKLA